MYFMGIDPQDYGPPKVSIHARKAADFLTDARPPRRKSGFAPIFGHRLGPGGAISIRAWSLNCYDLQGLVSSFSTTN
jgi:hypothetical protein